MLIVEINMNKLILMMYAVLLTGCAASYHAEKINESELLAQQKKWLEAYSNIEIELTYCGEPEKLHSLIMTYPDIIYIGMRDVFRQRLGKIGLVAIPSG